MADRYHDYRHPSRGRGPYSPPRNYRDRRRYCNKLIHQIHDSPPSDYRDRDRYRDRSPPPFYPPPHRYPYEYFYFFASKINFVDHTTTVVLHTKGLYRENLFHGNTIVEIIEVVVAVEVHQDVTTAVLHHDPPKRNHPVFPRISQFH